MDSGVGAKMGDDLDPPSRIFDRLRQIAGYSWDESQAPVHTSYDNWHIFGTRFVSPHSAAPSTTWQNVASPPDFTPVSHSDASSERSATSPPVSSAATSDLANLEEQPVVARVSYHVLREERSFQTCKSIQGDHVVRPIDLIRLSPRPDDHGAIIVAIYEYPGHNYLFDVMDHGPAFYFARKVEDKFTARRSENFQLKEVIRLEDFLNFALGASRCLEVLHHQHGIVHGEIRSDAFHFNRETNKVKLTSFGSGVRSFEHGLTSTGWSTLSKELGAKHKLCFISPEQTGRMPAEPDTRTDIYSLGIVFWQLLTQQPVFTGDSPLDVVQCVLSRPIPLVSRLRPDVPGVLSDIIQKATWKNTQDRYHSVSGLRHDLEKVQMSGDGDWEIGSQDVSSFFRLPTNMIGRDKERRELVKVIERVAKGHALLAVNSRFSDVSSMCNDLVDTADASSDCTSSAEGNRRSGSFTTQTLSSDLRISRGTFPNGNDTVNASEDTVSSSPNFPGPQLTRAWRKHQSLSLETWSLSEQNSERQTARLGAFDGGSPRRVGSLRCRRRGLSEVVLVTGTGGLGKSFLVQQALADVRRRGCFVATAKFDQVRSTPYPVLKLVSSLFQQVWGERNTETALHLALKDYAGPIWPMLHKILGLPEFLFGSAETAASMARSASSTHSPPKGRTFRAFKRRGSSPGGSPSASYGRLTTRSSQDYIPGAGSTKTLRLMNAFLEILRIFTSFHFICFAVDDLHFADDESLEFMTQMLAAKFRMAVVITYRPEEMAAENMAKMLQATDEPRLTRIVVSPLREQETVQYVSATLNRPAEDVAPLSLVIQSKTAGNPFLIREMLSSCYRAKCIWYDYRENRWQFDLDRVFDEFKSTDGDDVLDNEFVTKRLSELPSAARAILAWASLLGNQFSFDLVCKLLSGEFDSHSDVCLRRYSSKTAVAGLQAAVNACIIIQGKKDDSFQFAHDRYIQAATSLFPDQDRGLMHFAIAQALLKYYAHDVRYKDQTAIHICESVEVIKERVPCRRRYRQFLFQSGRDAFERGARAYAAAHYMWNAIHLLQARPWDEGEEDVFYDETLALHLGLAEAYQFTGADASPILHTIFSQAKTAESRAPASLLYARGQAQAHNYAAALRTLKESLASLKVELEEQPTFEKCDAEFVSMCHQLRSMDRADIGHVAHAPEDAEHVDIVGAILSDACYTSFWADCLDYYLLTITMMRIHLERGPFPQSGMAFLNFAVVALARFSMIEYSTELGTQGLELLGRLRDPFLSARGYVIYASFVAHVQVPMAVSLKHLEDAAEYAAGAGDRTSVILSSGLMVQIRFFTSENYGELEAICNDCCDVPGWQDDTRGGTMLIAIRQVCRAFQGKTRVSNALEVMSDEQHSSPSYKSWLVETAQNGGRSTLVYEAFELMPLYLYGHYEQACQVGRECLPKMHLLWSARTSRLVVVFYGLAAAGLMFQKLADPRNKRTELEAEVQDTITCLEALSKQVKDWEVLSDVNYLAWSKWLDAQTEELRMSHGTAMSQYETAIDHAAEHNFTFEEALGNLLMAGFFIRQSARRPAKALLRESLGLFQQLGASGIARRIEEDHSILLYGPSRNLGKADAGTQTDFTGDTALVSYPADGDEVRKGRHAALLESSQTRMAAWRGSMPESGPGFGLPALDMIDLHAILVSSQVISSVLQIDILLKTMCDVILQTCGGSASQAAIVVRQEDDEDGQQEDGADKLEKRMWCVAASGTPEKGAVAHMPGLDLGQGIVAENVVLYSVRFREAVFVADLINDERFSNVSDSWLQGKPRGRSVIAIPICHGDQPLLGVLYLEGEPGAFTDRSVSVSQLLVNQIGISYSNALSMKAIERSENKAKAAEAEAKRNVKMAEEAAKAKSIFLANVSHELRTPLNGVIGNSELLRDSNLNREQLEMADSIRVSADLLLTVINDILDFSKMEADKMKLYIIAFDPQEMVREVVRAVSYSNREKTSTKNVRIVQDIDLPRMLIYGDPIRLHQVLGNLIGNSLKFTEHGSITIGARIEAETAESAQLTFWVKDTGIGIPQQQLTKLFKPFSQADGSTARKYGGSGLGLSICRNLIQNLMKGRIELESEEGAGTTCWFSVTFDKARPEVFPGQERAVPMCGKVTPPTPSAGDPPPNPYLDLSLVPKEEMRICIAEDNLINQRIACKYVRKLGYTNLVEAYDNGLKAVEALRKRAKEGKAFHIILMDVQMPVLDGLAATKLLREDAIESVRNVLVIAMTASAIQGDREKCLAAGMNDYLAKPVKQDLLKKKIEAYTNPGPAAARPSEPSMSAAAGHVSTRSVTASPPVSSELNGTGTSLGAIHENAEVGSLDQSLARNSDPASLPESTAADPAKPVGRRDSERLPRKPSKGRAGSGGDDGPLRKAVSTKENSRHSVTSVDEDDVDEGGLHDAHLSVASDAGRDDDDDDEET